MKFEINVKRYKDIEKYLDIKCNTISVGDEGCIWKLPETSELKILADKILSKGYSFKFITPRVPQEHFETVINIIKFLSEQTKKYTLVINDFGVLEYAYENHFLPEGISIGRSISRSVEECPWYEDVIKNEGEKFKIDLSTNNFTDNEKIDLFRDYGVDEIESSLLPQSHYGYEWIKEKGWKVNAHVGNVTVAYSRNCQYAKFKKLSIGRCSDDCNDKVNIKMIGATNAYEQFDVINKYSDKQLELYLLGNILYKENKVNLEDINLSGIDSIVLSTDDYDIDEIKNIIERGAKL